MHQSYSLGAATRSALPLQSGTKGKRPDGLAQVPGDGHSGLLVKPLFVIVTVGGLDLGSQELGNLKYYDCRIPG